MKRRKNQPVRMGEPDWEAKALRQMLAQAKACAEPPAPTLYPSRPMTGAAMAAFAVPQDPPQTLKRLCRKCKIPMRVGARYRKPDGDERTFLCPRCGLLQTFRWQP